MLVFLGLVSRANHATVFYQKRAPLELVIANQPSHYVSIWDFLISGPILYTLSHRKRVKLSTTEF